MRALLLLLLLAFGLESRAQYIVAGQPGPKYTDVNPDVTLNGYTSYSVDINQDGSDDINISVVYFTPASGTLAYCEATTLNSSTQLFDGPLDSCHKAYPSPGYSSLNLAKQFTAGDTIKSGAALGSGEYFSYYNTTVGMNCMKQGWMNAGDKYLGVKYQDLSGTFYGWVRLNVTYYSSLIIKDYSLNQPVSAGVQERSADASSFMIFPQPAHDELQVKMNCRKPDQTVLEIVNTIGEVVSRKNFSAQIVVSDLSPGCYILRILEPDQPARCRRFVKE